MPMTSHIKIMCVAFTVQAVGARCTTALRATFSVQSSPCNTSLLLRKALGNLLPTWRNGISNFYGQSDRALHRRHQPPQAVLYLRRLRLLHNLPRQNTSRPFLLAQPPNFQQSFNHLFVAKVAVVLKLRLLVICHSRSIDQDPSSHPKDPVPWLRKRVARCAVEVAR